MLNLTKINLKAVIFDMDGVIVDSQYQWHQLEYHFLEDLLPDWKKIRTELTGLSVQDEYVYLRERYNLKIGLKDYTKEYDIMAQVIYEQRCNLTEGCEELLTALGDENFTIALASSSPCRWISIVLDRFNLGRFFVRTVGSDEVGGRGKPSPDIYLYTAHQINTAPAQCIAIEDSKNGVLAAKEAGMYCIGLLNGFNEKHDLLKADIVAHSFYDITTAKLVD